MGSLPRPLVQLGSTEGFLYEWWTVFWDVFRAKGDRAGSQAARNYVESKGIVHGAQHRVRLANLFSDRPADRLRLRSRRLSLWSILWAILDL